MSEQQYITFKDGRRRKAQLVTCLHCGKEFLKLESEVGKKSHHYKARHSKKNCNVANRGKVKIIMYNFVYVI